MKKLISTGALVALVLAAQSASAMIHSANSYLNFTGGSLPWVRDRPYICLGLHVLPRG